MMEKQKPRLAECKYTVLYNSREGRRNEQPLFSNSEVKVTVASTAYNIYL